MKNSEFMTNPGSILIVDDDPASLHLLRAILVKAGYRVQSAASGETALQAMSAEVPDLVMLDVYMPVMNGYEVCRDIKRNPPTQDIPVVFISASDEKDDRTAAFSAGGVDYVSKPFCVEEVLGRVRAQVSLYHHRRELERQVAQRTRQLADSEAHLRQLSEFLLRVREEDRRHFARELHDELGQNLTALRIDFKALSGDLGPTAAKVSGHLAAIDAMLNTTVDSIRRICEDLRPGMLDDLGLEAALASLARRFSAQNGIACELSLACEDFGLDDHLSTAIYRIVQEALTNIARHAQARHAMIALEAQGDRLLLTIADDGRGLPVETDEARRSFGIVGIRERVNLLRGEVVIDSSPGRGTHIEVSLPRSREGAM